MSYSARRLRTWRCSSSLVVVHSKSSDDKSGKDASGSRTDPSNSLMTLSLETSAAPQSGHWSLPARRWDWDSQTDHNSVQSSPPGELKRASAGSVPQLFPTAKWLRPRSGMTASVQDERTGPGAQVDRSLVADVEETWIARETVRCLRRR